MTGLKVHASQLTTLLLLLAAVLTGCVHVPPDRAVHAGVAADAQALRNSLIALSPDVLEAEAEEVTACAFDYSHRLARDYAIVRPPWFHNCLVNTGLKHRGLCHEWADDLLARLQELKLTSLELHWGIARADSWREHNSVVIGATGQPFEQGIVLDPWRASGRLMWSPVKSDAYRWAEGSLTPARAPVTP